VVIDQLSAETFRHLNASVVLAEDSLSIAEDPRNTIVKILKAANVEEAVAVATELKRNGQYDWFRGQLREWNPASSLERKLHQNPDAQIEINAKLNRFFTWAQAYPALAYLLQEENIDALVAVLQHYGVATSYIDFTTEPSIAGFFASDATTLPVEEGNSVIYCLNTTDLVEFYDDLKIDKAFMHLQAMPVTVDVPNLWRLQSQHGHFLFANHSWYQYYEMDRIVFPWSGTPAYPSRDQIYPVHKSALEQSLDAYFFNEHRVESDAALRAMAEAAGKQSLFKHVALTEPETYRKQSFISPLVAAEHWSDYALKDWFSSPVEHFDSTVGRRIPVALRSDAAAPSPADQIRHSINSALNLQPKIRAEAVEWSFTGLPSDVNEQLFSSSTRAAWNGMRNLPFTDNDIASAFSALVILCSLPDCQSSDGKRADQAFTGWIADVIRVEFGSQDGSYSRAYCSDRGLFEALEPAWVANLREPESISSIHGAFKHTHDPRLMFDFKRLANIFAREIIPSQLALRRPVVLFNPAHLEVLGLP
jgi:hypothetical protein